MKYQLPFITIIVRFRRHDGVIVIVLCKCRLCLVTLQLALFFRPCFVGGDTVCAHSIYHIIRKYIKIQFVLRGKHTPSLLQKPVSYCSEITHDTTTVWAERNVLNVQPGGTEK